MTINRVRVETSFNVDSNRDPIEVFEGLANALFTEEATSTHLEDADVSSAEFEFTLAIVGVADSVGKAAGAANAAIRQAMLAARVADSVPA